MKGTRTLLVAALAGALALPAALRAQDSNQTPDDGDKKPCWGVNKCKGTGDCGAEGCRQSGCHGSNACKGKGFLRINPETCLKIQGGSLTRAAARPVHKKTSTKKTA
jgi:uncharacterized membrane protein